MRTAVNDPPRELEIGSEFLGYRIEEVIGQGGMGTRIGRTTSGSNVLSR